MTEQAQRGRVVVNHSDGVTEIPNKRANWSFSNAIMIPFRKDMGCVIPCIEKHAEV
jgi:hypothetical protein